MTLTAYLTHSDPHLKWWKQNLIEWILQTRTWHLICSWQHNNVKFWGTMSNSLEWLLHACMHVHVGERTRYGHTYVMTIDMRWKLNKFVWPHTRYQIFFDFVGHDILFYDGGRPTGLCTCCRKSYWWRPLFPLLMISYICSLILTPFDGDRPLVGV